jgi:hypothetical protein
MNIRWFIGLTIDEDGRVTRWVCDPKSGSLVSV